MTLLVERRVGAETVGQVTDYTAIRWAEEVNTATGGTITLPAGSETLEHMRLARSSTDPVGLLITDQDSGHSVPVYFAEVVRSSAPSVTAQFRLDLAMLNEVPAFPDPSDPAAAWSTVSHWERTGDAVTETAQYLLVHGGQFSHPDYRHFESVTNAAAAGVTITFRARMQPSLDFLRGALAGAAIIQARIEDGVTRLFVRAPIDRPEVVFSPELHTLDDWVLRDRMPPANVAFGAGAGEGTARVQATVSATGSSWPRKRGVFVDRANMTAAELQLAAAEALAWAGPTMVATAHDSAAQSYGVDFQLGDTVRVEVEGDEFTLPVTSVETEATADGEPTRKIQLGEAPVDDRPDLELHRHLLRRYGLQEPT